MKSKIIQISGVPGTGYTHSACWALCEDGSVWKYDSKDAKWYEIREPFGDKVNA